MHDDDLFVIDFDDAGFGWYLYDIAVALYSPWTEEGFEAVQDAFVSGYRSGRPLAEEDLARLPVFLHMRDLAILGWLDARPELPQHAFLPEAIKAACARAKSLLA